MVGAVALRSAGGLVFACDAGFGVLDDAGARIELEHSRVGERMNDAKVDPAGRLWAGSTALDFAAGRGALHVVDSSWRHEVALTGLTLPNGMDWSPDGKTYYLVDSYQRSLYAFDYVRSSGALGERRVLMTFPETWGLADGLTVDAAGRLWVAVWGGSRLLAISPDGDLLGSIDVPVVQPSSCAFGAAGYRTLFITSARDGLAVDADAADGSVFAVEVDGAYGRPVVAFGAPA
jgi:sugar lactone lactonase YvrE